MHVIELVECLCSNSISPKMCVCVCVCVCLRIYGAIPLVWVYQCVLLTSKYYHVDKPLRVPTYQPTLVDDFPQCKWQQNKKETFKIKESKCL